MDAPQIVVDPRIMGGQPIIKGARITVALIVRELKRGATLEEIIDQYRQLTAAHIRAAATHRDQTRDRT
jgi:uncharacterized protein (DUF433 family)